MIFISNNIIYQTINENGKLETHSYEQDQLNSYLNDLRISHSDIVSEYKAIEGFNPREIFNNYRESAEQTINEVNSLEGELYTPEGKKAEIRKQIQELAANKKQEADSLVNTYQERHGNLLDKIDKEINQQEDLTADEVARITLRNNELLGETKGKLYSINNTRDLEHEFRQLADESKKDETLARFLTKNYYLFLDRVKELDTSEMDKQRAIHRITELANTVKKEGFSKAETALYALRERLGNKSFFATSVKRNIDQYTDQHLRKYQ